MRELGNFIRLRRGFLDVTQQELADQVGVAQTLVSRIELGNKGSVPDPALMQRYADALAVSVDDLLLVYGYNLTGTTSATKKQHENVSSPTIYTLMQTTEQTELPERSKEFIRDALNFVQHQEQIASERDDDDV